MCNVWILLACAWIACVSGETVRLPRFSFGCFFLGGCGSRMPSSRSPPDARSSPLPALPLPALPSKPCSKPRGPLQCGRQMQIATPHTHPGPGPCTSSHACEKLAALLQRARETPLPTFRLCSDKEACCQRASWLGSLWRPGGTGGARPFPRLKAWLKGGGGGEEWDPPPALSTSAAQEPAEVTGKDHNFQTRRGSWPFGLAGAVCAAERGGVGEFPPV